MVFVVIEGLDASGKSTQALRLKEHLEDKGYKVYIRFHPAVDNWAGCRARRFLLAEGLNAHFASAIFYIVDVLRSVILTPWRSFDYVVYVRYLMGTAYLPFPLAAFAYNFFATLLPRPRHTVFLDITPEEAYRRVVLRNSSREMFESLVQLRKIRVRATTMARANSWDLINGDKKFEDVEKQIWSILFPKKEN